MNNYVFSEQFNYDYSSVENAMKCLKNMQDLESLPNYGQVGEFVRSNRYNVENYVDEIDSRNCTNIAVDILNLTIEMLGINLGGFESNGIITLSFPGITDDSDGIVDYLETNFLEYEILDNGCYYAKDSATGDMYIFPSNFTGDAITVGAFIPGQGYSWKNDGLDLLISGYKDSGVPDDFVFVSALNTMDKDEVLSVCDELAASGMNVGTVKIAGFSGGGDAALRAIGNYKQSHPNVNCEALLLDPYDATGKNGNSMYASNYPDLSNVSLAFVDIGGTGSYNRIENDIIANGFTGAVHYHNQNSITHGMCVKDTVNSGLFNSFMFGNSNII